MILEVGRVCRKLKGRDANSYCVVVEKAGKNHVLVEGKGIKRTKTNILHLEPLPKVLDIKKGASTEDVIKKLEKEKLA